MFRADLMEERAFDNGIAFLWREAWYAFTSDTRNGNTYFAVSRSKDWDEAISMAKEALNAEIDDIAEERRKYFDNIPELSLGSELGRKVPAIKPAEFVARLSILRDFGWSACLYVAMAMKRNLK